jgi:hypothetical protein
VLSLKVAEDLDLAALLGDEDPPVGGGGELDRSRVDETRETVVSWNPVGNAPAPDPPPTARSSPSTAMASRAGLTSGRRLAGRIKVVRDLDDACDQSTGRKSVFGVSQGWGERPDCLVMVFRRASNPDSCYSTTM